MSRRTRLAAGVLIAGGVAVVALLTSPQLVLDRLTWLTADPLRLAGALVLLAIVRPFLAWPTTLLALLAGYGYGLPGIPIALGLLVLTGFPPYLLARRGRAGGPVSAASERVVDATGAVRAIVISRLLPTPSDAISVAAGLAGVAAGPFALGTLLGELPWAIAGVLVGDAADRVLAEGLGAALDPRLLGAMIVLALALSVRPLVEWLRDGEIAG
jgi:uncharacterized membrane protein YdjX (TVP38/TMEM64 family)